MKTSKSEFQKKFNSIAKNYDFISNTYTVKRRAESFDLNSDKLILETGSGSGLVTEFYDSKVISTDFSFEMCKQAKDKHNYVVCCDAEFLPFKKNVFDVIISAEMIYYLEKPEMFISYCCKILKNNGLLLFSFPNEKMTIVDKMRRVLRKLGFNKMYFDDGIRDFIKIDKLKFLLNNNNFQIISIEKQVLFPFFFLDGVNRFLEKTFLNYFSIFVIVRAKVKDI